MQGEEEEEEGEEEERKGDGTPPPKDDLGFDDPFFQHDVTTATAVSLQQLSLTQLTFHNIVYWLLM